MARMQSWLGHLRGAIPIPLKDLYGKLGFGGKEGWAGN